MYELKPFYIQYSIYWQKDTENAAKSAAVLQPHETKPQFGHKAKIYQATLEQYSM